jgi:hypothetical protein
MKRKRIAAGLTALCFLACLCIMTLPAPLPAAMVSPLEASASPTLRRVLESDVWLLPDLSASRTLSLRCVAFLLRMTFPPVARACTLSALCLHRGYALPAYVLSINHPQLAPPILSA